MSLIKEKQVSWSEESLRGTEFLHARFVQQRFQKHAHMTYVIGLIEEGTESFNCRGRVFHATKNSILLINPDEAHDGWSGTKQGWKYRTFYPTPELMREVSRDILGKDIGVPLFEGPVIRDQKIASNLKDLHFSSQSGEATELEIQTRFIALAEGLLQRHFKGANYKLTQRSDKKRVEKVKEYLNSNWYKNVSLDALANEFGISPAHLLRLFSQSTGIAPHQYQNSIRVRKAKEFIREGNQLADVAVQAGFYDQSHMNRFFRKVTGIRPGAYLRRK